MTIPFSPPASRTLCKLAGLLFLLAVQAAQADTVWLDNGDRLTGTVKSLDGGVLLIGTDYGGDIRVTFSHVKTLDSTVPLVIRDKSVAREYQAKLVSADKGKVVLEGTEENLDGDEAASTVKKDVALNDITSIVRPHPFLKDFSFTGKLDASLNRTDSSTDTQNYALAGSAKARHGMWRHTLDGSYARSAENGEVNTDNYSASYALDRFLTEKAFWEGRISHRQDWVEDVRRQTAYGTGPGYQFWDDERGAFSLAALLGGVNYHYEDGSNENSLAGSVRWDYVHYLSGKQYELYTHGEVMRPLGAGAKFAVNGEVGARYNMNKWLNLYVKYARDQVSGSQGSLNESVYGTGIGVTW